jgi:hypothetical protein
MNPNSKERLETALHGALRRLPGRKAPWTLEARVLEEIARRAALPWWRKSFAGWPVAAKAGFIATCVLADALIMLTLLAANQTHAAQAVSGNLSSVIGWYAMGRDAVGAAGVKLSSLVASVPRLWLYGTVAAVASSYAALGAIGAAAYRAVFIGRQNP